MNDTQKLIQTVINYYDGCRKWVTFPELLRFLKTPPTPQNDERKAMPYIKEIESRGDLLKVTLTDCILYYPKAVGLHNLYMVIHQIYYPQHWHYYETDHMVVEQEDIVLDCGAAEGLFSAKIANRCKRVFAIEPSPVWHSCLEQTISQYPNAAVMKYAVSNQSGFAYIVDNATSSAIKREKGAGVRVPLKTIDEIFADGKYGAVSYIKADLEGADLDMLIGASETIFRYKPRLAITTYHVRDHAVEMTRVIKKIHSGYTISYRGITLKNSPVMLHAWI